MRKIFIIFVILSLTSCYFLIPPTKLGVMIDNENIACSYFSEAIPGCLKINVDFFKDKFVVLGSQGLKILDKNDINKSKYIKYQESIVHPYLIMIDGRMHIIDGGGGFGDLGLMDEKGKLIWKYPLNQKDFRAFEMEGGDLNNDGMPEFYVATSNGLHVLDSNGILMKILGAGKSVFGGFELGTYNDQMVIITLDYINRKFYLWNFHGDLLKTIERKKYIWDFSLINWPSENYILANDGESFYILDFDGNIILNINAGFTIQALRGTGIHFKNGKNYLAVLTRTRSVHDRSILWIFSPDGKLIYKEVLCSTEAIVAIKNNEKNHEDLLVGGCNSINKYEMK